MFKKINFIRKENSKELEGEEMFVVKKYDLFKVSNRKFRKYLTELKWFLSQHRVAEEIVIEQKGVFKKVKGMRYIEKIKSYGDERDIWKRDFFKPQKPASPFFNSELSTVRILNKTGKTLYDHRGTCFTLTFLKTRPLMF